jgi:hypothetical protein
MKKGPGGDAGLFILPLNVSVQMEEKARSAEKKTKPKSSRQDR